MMRRRGGRKLLVIIPLAILAVALFGFIVMNLWNVVVPAVFGGKIITFWQALGLLVLTRILVGGIFQAGRIWGSTEGSEGDMGEADAGGEGETSRGDAGPMRRGRESGVRKEGRSGTCPAHGY